jgi:hypothetical protein
MLGNPVENTRWIILITIVVAGLLLAVYYRRFEVEVANNPLEIISSTPLDVNVTNASIDVNATITIPSVETNMEKYEDAFGRIRMSDQYTLGDYKHIYFNDSSYLNVSGNGGSLIYDQNESSVVLNVSTTVDSFAIHQTRMYHHYQPGKSQLVKSSFVFGPSTPNVIKRSGLFDNDEGIYLEMNNSALSWNIRNIISGTPTVIETSPRNSWLDPLDGSGPSGVTLDFTKTQLIFIDFQWLGVGRVRCGFIHDGRAILTTEFYHSNVLATPYLRSPSLPVRCEIRGIGGNSGSMKQICATVISEGGYAETGQDFSISAGNVGRACPVAGTRYPILAIRLKNTFKGLPNRVSVRLTNFTVYVENHGVLWELWKLSSSAALSGTVVWADANSDESAVERSIHPTTINTTGALQLTSGFLPAGNQNAGNNALSIPDPTKAKRITLSQNFDSTDSEIFVVTMTAVGTGNNTNTNAFASMQWREIY